MPKDIQAIVIVFLLVIEFCASHGEHLMADVAIAIVCTVNRSLLLYYKSYTYYSCSHITTTIWTGTV